MSKYLIAFLGASLAGAFLTAGEADCSGPDCGACHTRKVCVPEPTTVKTSKNLYDDKCVDFCLKRCHCKLFGGHGGCAGDCGGCTKCEKVRTKKVLIIKIKTEECPGTKCVVKEEVCDDCPSKRKLFHKEKCVDGHCPDSCGATIIMEGTGPALTIPGAEPLAPPKNIP